MVLELLQLVVRMVIFLMMIIVLMALLNAIKMMAMMISGGDCEIYGG